MSKSSLPDYFTALQHTSTPVSNIGRFLRGAGRPDTLRHASHVAAVGRAMARHYGLPVERVDLACIAHDLAAVVPLREIVGVAEGLGVPLTAADYAIPQVVHGAVAAAVLRHNLGVNDQAVLDAITYHSTLRAEAAPLEQVVFVADKLAYDLTTPNTGYHARLGAALFKADLATLCWIYLDWAVTEGPRLGWRLHPNLVAAEQALRPTPTPP